MPIPIHSRSALSTSGHPSSRLDGGPAIARTHANLTDAMPVGWLPMTDVDRSALWELATVLAPLPHAFPSDPETVFAGCDGRWAEYLGMLAEAGGIEEPYRPGHAGRAFETGFAATALLADLHLVPERPGAQPARIHEFMAWLVVSGGGLLALARFGARLPDHDLIARSSVRNAGPGLPFDTAFAPGAFAPSLFHAPCASLADLVSGTWAGKGPDTFGFVSHAVDCLLGPRETVDLSVGTEAGRVPVARISLAWTARGAQALNAPDVVIASRLPLDNVVGDTRDCLVVESVIAADGIDAVVARKAADAFRDAVRAGRVPHATPGKPFPRGEADALAEGRWIVSPTRESLPSWSGLVDGALADMDTATYLERLDDYLRSRSGAEIEDDAVEVDLDFGDLGD